MRFCDQWIDFMLKPLIFVLFFFINCTANSETLIIGSVTMNPPFESIIDNQPLFFGFEVDMMQEICHRIGAQCKFKAYLLNDLFNMIQEGKVDLGIAALINPGDRFDEFLHTLPYLPSYVRLMTRRSSSLNSIADLSHKKIGIRQMRLYHRFILEHLDADADITEYPSMSALLDALVKNNIEVALVNSIAANYWHANSGGIYKLLGDKIQLGFGYAAIARKDNIYLVARVNQAILAMQNDGRYQQIYNRYFGNAMT